MRRWSAAAFFIGLALLCGALIEFHRWPTLQVRTHHGDFDEIEGYSHIWFPEVESRWQQLTAAFRQPDPFDGFGANRLVERGLVGFLALAGLGLVLIRRGSVGGTLLAAGVTSGLVLLALTALDLRGNDRGIGCSPAPNPLDSPELISFASRFALSAAVLCAAAWVWSSRAAGITLLRSLGAAGIALAMVAVAFVFDLLAFDEASLDLSTPMPALWPLWIIAGLAAGGVWVALRSELFVSHAVSLLIVVAGLVAIFTGIALEHDLAVDVHQTFVTIRRPRSALVFTHCEEPAISIALAVSRDEVLLSGWVFRPGDEELSIAVSDQLRELESQYVQAWEQTGIAPTAFMDRQFLLEVEPDASFETVVAAVQGLQLAGAHRLQLVSIVDRPEVLWTKSAPHRHPCAVSFELSADGKPMSEFANWSQLLTAIDASPTPLKISAR